MTEPLFDAVWLGLLALIVAIALDLRSRVHKK
jgi:hypothetical protein